MFADGTFSRSYAVIKKLSAKDAVSFLNYKQVTIRYILRKIYLRRNQIGRNKTLGNMEDVIEEEQGDRKIVEVHYEPLKLIKAWVPSY